ncbi:MAG: acyl-CoA thioesterase [Clostridiales Family XIII bacterium]|jgi:acyl-CoA hydrolase|nr:acyl-CoA thioesterase [Clostridiales Family XIII bacterium]
MATREEKGVTLSTIMMPEHANPQGNVHGGEVMKMMDNTAGCAAAKYSRTRIVTARVDELQFLEPVRVADFVTSHGEVVYTGRTSMEVFITVDVENFHDGPGSKRRALEAYFTLVALDDDGRPTPVPAYAPETEEEKQRWEYVHKRRANAPKR